MDKIKLTIDQTNILFNVTEHQMKWYVKYYPTVPSFEELLELNYDKLSKFFLSKPECEYEEEEITDKLLEMKTDYINMLINTNDVHKKDK